MTASWNTYRQIKLGLGAFGGVAALLATPPYRLFALATLPMVVIATLPLPNRRRFLPPAAYLLFGLCGFLIGEFFWEVGGLSWSGIKLMILVLAAAIISTICMFRAVPGEA